MNLELQNELQKELTFLLNKKKEIDDRIGAISLIINLDKHESNKKLDGAVIESRTNPKRSASEIEGNSQGGIISSRTTNLLKSEKIGNKKSGFYRETSFIRGSHTPPNSKN